MLSVTACIASLALLWLAKAVSNFIRHRKSFESLPGPKSSLLFGHLEFLDKHLNSPTEAPDCGALRISKQYGGLIFLDIWPFRDPMCIVTDATLAEKILRIDDLPKDRVYDNDWEIIGSRSLVALNGPTKSTHDEWHALRAAFNPGFKKGILERNWTEIIAKEAEGFVGRLKSRAQDHAEFKMMDYMIDMTFAVIGHVVLGEFANLVDMDKVQALMAVQSQRLSDFNAAALPVVKRWNPFLQKRMHQSSELMNSYLRPAVQAIMRQSTEQIKDKRRQSVLELALQDDQSQFPLQVYIDQVKTLLFAGHDTTASTLSWTFHELSRHPKYLQDLRKEMDRIFGTTSVRLQLRKDLSVLNQVILTTAVLKETLRLHPVGGGARRTDKDYFVDYKGSSYNLKGFLLWSVNFAYHREPEIFGSDAEEFVPERWFVDRDIAKGPITTPMAWHPFSKGSRNCIGNELALLEQKIIVAMTVREFNFESCLENPTHVFFGLTVEIGESIIARTECLGSFRELGPPDLAHIIKSSRTGAKELGSYHYVSGIDASSSASLAAYLNSLTYNIDQPSGWLGGKAKSEFKITRACYACFNAFSRVDVRVEVKIPGGVDAYVIDARNERHALTPQLWTEVYLSAVLRSILYADDVTYRLAGYRKLEPIKSTEDEIRFLAAAEQLFAQGWQLGSDPEIQVATAVRNHLTSGIVKYFSQAFRFQPAVNLFEKLVVKDGEVAALLAQCYLGMDEEVKAVQVLHSALAEYSHSYNLLHIQCDFLRSKGRADWAVELAKTAVNCAPSEFVTWSKLTEVNIELERFSDALLTLNSCPMFTYNERDLHRMPTPARTHLPMKSFILDTNILEPANESGAAGTVEDENQADPTLLRMPAPGLRGTFKEAYRLLTKLVSVIGWDELLRTRSQVFVMEEEYRQQKAQPETHVNGHAATNGHVDEATPRNEEESADEAASTTTLRSKAKSVVEDFKEQERSGSISVPSSPIPTIKVSSESDAERDELVEEGIIEPVEGVTTAQVPAPVPTEPISDLNASAGIEKPVMASVKEEDTAASATSSHFPASPTTPADPDVSFSNKRLCERWLDNLFMVLYEDLRVLTVWRAEMAHFKAQHMPYRKTATEWEILGDLALRLHRKEEAKEAYQRSLDAKFSAKAWLELLSMYVDERDVGRALNAAARLCAYNQRWYQDSAYPSAVGHEMFRLIKQEGISKVSYSLVSMRLPEPILKIMQTYFEWSQTFRIAGTEI